MKTKRDTEEEDNRQGAGDISRRISRALHSLVEKATKERAETKKEAETAIPPADGQLVPGTRPDPESAAEKEASERTPQQPSYAANKPLLPEADTADRSAVQRNLESDSEKPTTRATPRALDSASIYEGEVELSIAVPVDLAALARVYNYLQSAPDMKILYTRGSIDRGTTIAVSLEKPQPLIGMLSKIPGLKLTPAAPDDNPTRGSGPLFGAQRRPAARVHLVLKAE